MSQKQQAQPMPFVVELQDSVFQFNVACRICEQGMLSSKCGFCANCKSGDPNPMIHVRLADDGTLPVSYCTRHKSIVPAVCKVPKIEHGVNVADWPDILAAGVDLANFDVPTNEAVAKYYDSLGLNQDGDIVLLW